MDTTSLHKKNDQPLRILVIDDSKLNRAIVKKTLGKLDLDITEAQDGLEALDILKSESFDLILVDIIMPNLDGYGFIQEFKNMPGDEFVPVILMTGSEDLNSKIKGLNIGADDFLLKPLNEKELTARVKSLLRLKSAHDELYEKNMLIKRELDIAKKVQEFIIPTDFSFIPEPKVSGVYLPIEDIGGDYFDCYRLHDGSVGILIADVTGHGIPAAMVMTMSKMIFSIYASEFSSTSMLLAKVNREMRGLLLDNQYITAFYCIYNPVTGELHFTNAGHSRPLFYRKSAGKVMALDTDGLFIGIMDSTTYEEKKIIAEPGDTLFLYTDGITEIRNSENEEFGEKRLARFVRNNCDISGNDYCTALLDEIRAFTSLEDRNDDIAFLNVEF
ncbi:MAG TPA: fused response regulator/phosphatase [Spirochaetota bacterium]|nr:fused response regulator/phosphatase [Spirochaetota bacterium]HPJ39167.1 fused response regulator/phosphatase [Spirochaetota bacterium]HPQ52257.1 fused response regulator/phosphatase [Spirochaetota bacterium]